MGEKTVRRVKNAIKNGTPKIKTLIIAGKFDSRKTIDSVYPSGQNDQAGEKPYIEEAKTAKNIGNKFGCSPRKVRRCEKLHDGIEIIKKVNPEAARKILGI
ncbi:MAG: hypothetical protein ACYDHX_04920 [Methanothrix sp.]